MSAFSMTTSMVTKSQESMALKEAGLTILVTVIGVPVAFIFAPLRG